MFRLNERLVNWSCSVDIKNTKILVIIPYITLPGLGKPRIIIEIGFGKGPLYTKDALL